MTRIAWWIVLVFMSLAVVALDVLTPPQIQFPIAFAVPVSLAGWYLSSRAGIGFALALVACYFAISMTAEAGYAPQWATAVNGGILLIVLAGLAVLLAGARQKLRLQQRVRVLEGMLEICGFCKKIHCPDGRWEQLETYISERSAARFTHGFCEACGRKHYPEYFSDPKPSDGPS
ncbi:MAG TPA: hypothetical protein VMI94_16610 [Bryobacteraceae bacterium]|nr:hypothetical protein [Bryobacteraceae bacterium]